MNSAASYVLLVEHIEAVLATDLDASLKCKSIQMLISNVREDEVSE